MSPHYLDWLSVPQSIPSSHSPHHHEPENIPPPPHAPANTPDRSHRTPSQKNREPYRATPRLSDTARSTSPSDPALYPQSSHPPHRQKPCRCPPAIAPDNSAATPQTTHTPAAPH